MAHGLPLWTPFSVENYSKNRRSFTNHKNREATIIAAPSAQEKMCTAFWRKVYDARNASLL